MAQKTYRIGDVANLMGLSRDTLRYYEKRGILSSKKEENGYRYYTEEDIYRLFSILYQRKMDIGLDDLEQILVSGSFCFFSVSDYEKQNGRRKNGNPAPSANHGPIKSNQ